jgi:hypothetical protein
VAIGRYAAASSKSFADAIRLAANRDEDIDSTASLLDSSGGPQLGSAMYHTSGWRLLTCWTLRLRYAGNS